MSTGVAAGLRPGLAALRRHDLPAVRGDVLAGITVGAYLVPQVLAYAEVAGLAAVTGLWTAVAALCAYSVLGSSRQLSVGPESTTAILTAVAIAPLAAGDGAATQLWPVRSRCWLGPSACSGGWHGSGFWPTCCRGRYSSGTSPASL